MAAYTALLSLMRIIDNLQLHHRPPISLHKDQVHLLTQKTTFLQEFLEGYNPSLGYSSEADPLESHIADAAHAAEDVIESHIVDHITNDGEKINPDGLYEALEKVIEGMAMVENEAMEIKGSERVQNQLQRSSTPHDSSRYSSSVAEQSRMVGADQLLLQMKDKLTSHCLDLQIIPIVGMGGSGKTTLARNLYQDRLIKEHFHICAWTTISQEYNIREILVQVLKQLSAGGSQDLSEGALGEMLHKYLYGRKYMIVLDDMWSIRAWDGVKRCLPNNKNGSRIVVTTRLSNLASDLPNSSSLDMKLLDKADSWDLFSKTVFGEEGCPLEFEEIGKKIAKSCKGLPLSIVVVGGLLAKCEHTIEFWEYIEENLNSVVNLEDGERCLRVLYMSYKHLLVYLKPCFLYMGVYPEDEMIHISRLIRLWVAEGFIKAISGKSLEETAKVYVKDLISKNLILNHKLGNTGTGTGSMKYCKIHDLLRDLSLREAEKERFYIPNTQGIVNRQRRIVLTSKEAINALSSSMPLARSFIWHLYAEPPPLNFRLLRILQSIAYFKRVPEFLESMHQLVNSRFLAFNLVTNCKFPCSIWQFWNLETIIVGGNTDLIIAPADIWYMPHIRHLEFHNLYLPDPPKDAIVLVNLQMLGKIRNFKPSEQVVKIIPNIKKLSIFCDEKLDDDDGYCLTNLDCLDTLESLTCSLNEEIRERGTINFPHSLKKTFLGLFECCEVILDKIGSLPLLEKLTLYSECFKDGQWKTTEGHFRSLKFLALRRCRDLKIWKTESSHFPCLEHLLCHTPTPEARRNNKHDL